MRRSSLWLCVIGIVFWTGAWTPAQGQQERRGAVSQARERAARAATAPAADANAMARARAAKEDANALQAAGAQRGKAMEEGQAKAGSPGLGRQGPLLQKQLRETRAKHMERMAKLNRIHELALKKGDAQMLARVDKLIVKEQDLFARRQDRMQRQPRAAPPAGAPALKAGKDAGTGAKERKMPEPKPEKPK
jgi:hypothetical protein